jgi:hypothetical protein
MQQRSGHDRSLSGIFPDWDRLPMTLSFAAIFALVVKERVGEKAGTIALWPMLAIGVASLLLWLWVDDLRLYFWAQFFPGLALLVLLAFYPAKYTDGRYWLIAAALYALRSSISPPPARALPSCGIFRFGA